MSAAERMRAALNATGSYRLTGETSADWELNACAAGLDALESGIDALLAGLFPATAGEEDLARAAGLFWPQPLEGTLEARRQALTARGALNPRGFTPGAMNAAMRAAGLRGRVEAGPAGVRVLVSGRDRVMNEENVKRTLEAILPAHLAWSMASLVDWTVFESLIGSFAALEAAGLTWAQLDGMELEELRAAFGAQTSEEG